MKECALNSDAQRIMFSSAKEAGGDATVKLLIKCHSALGHLLVCDRIYFILSAQQGLDSALL